MIFEETAMLVCIGLHYRYILWVFYQKKIIFPNHIFILIFKHLMLLISWNVGPLSFLIAHFLFSSPHQDHSPCACSFVVAISLSYFTSPLLYFPWLTRYFILFLALFLFFSAFLPHRSSFIVFQQVKGSRKSRLWYFFSK